MIAQSLETSDLYFAVFIRFKGNPAPHANVRNGKVYFVFDDISDVASLAKEYEAGRWMDFARCVKEVKDILHSTLRGGKDEQTINR